MLLPGPPRLDEAGWELLLRRTAGISAAPGGLDLGGVKFIDPYGLLGLLAMGMSPSYRRGHAWGVILPCDGAVRAFLERSGALPLLEDLFILEGPPAGGRGGERPGRGEPLLLEVAPIREHTDVHRAVARVKGRADRLLVQRLGYNALAADRFTVALAEICQNIVDHSESEGFVFAHVYSPSRGRKMVRLAVTDTGVGVRRSLSAKYASLHPGSWDDRRAVRFAFRRWVSRFEESGRGMGLKLVAQMVRGWGGRLLLRSGTAAYAVCPPWGPRPRRSDLPPFPGTQINIFLPSADP